MSLIVLINHLINYNFWIASSEVVDQPFARYLC